MPDCPSNFDASSLPGVTDQEVTQLTDIIRVVTSDCAPPTIQLAIPTEAASELFKYVCGFLRQFDVPRWFATGVAGMAVLPVLIINGVFSISIAVLQPVISVAFREILGLLDTLRKELDPTFADIAVLVLNELLGTDFTSAHLAGGIDVASHLARAEQVGAFLHNQLMSEFSTAADVTPESGMSAARRMSGFMINFGTATGIIGLLGGLVPFAHVDEIREIGEEVAKNLGLGRMHRLVMQPLIKSLIAAPYSWWINRQFHPTQFTIGDLVNPFQATQMSQTAIFQALDYLGYSDDKKQELIQLHQKRLSVSELDLLVRYGPLSQAYVNDYLPRLGFPAELQPVLLPLEDLKRAEGAVRQLIDEVMLEVKAGHLTSADLQTILANLPIGPIETRYLLDRVNFATQAPHAHLSLGEAQQAFELGLWTLDQLAEFLQARGYSADDANTLELLTLLKLSKLEEAKKVAQFAYDQKVAKAKSKNLPTPPPPAILSS